MAIFNMTAGDSRIPITGDDTTTKLKVKGATFVEIGPAEILDGFLASPASSGKKRMSANRESGVIYTTVNGNGGYIYSWNEDGTTTQIAAISGYYIDLTSFNDDDGFLYGYGYTNTSSNNHRRSYKIDTSAGTATLLGEFSLTMYSSGEPMTDIATKEDTLHFLGNNGESPAKVYYGEQDIETGTITIKFNQVSPPETSSRIHVNGELFVTGSGNVLGYYGAYIWNISDTITYISEQGYNNSRGFIGTDKRLAIILNPEWTASTYYYYPTQTHRSYDDETQTFIDKGDITLPEDASDLIFLFGMDNGKIREVARVAGNNLQRIDMDKLYTLTTE